ncbi:unnamed protein product [Diabrotica balteata]|uniref:acid phosphatase n=1 Tax=Diabrotica balteata TaxID=107213 RepID=A0A9P0H0X5_DIABA|nr:unnamed protein product [Diabrotica balteata]
MIIVKVAIILTSLYIVNSYRLNSDPQNIKQADSTVILTHVLFRHGNRTAELQETYPKDPYRNFTYFPIGRGQLTNAGKVREYQIGKDLRKRYDRLLGPVYYPEVVDAVTTNKNRTKASLELVLASLFKPKYTDVWNWALGWQPVPYNYYPVDQDPVLMGINCPRYQVLYKDLVNSAKWKAIFKKYQTQFDYISKNSGLNVTTFQEVYNMYFGLSTEEEYGQVLPPWTRSVWPKVIVSLSIKQYYVETGTTEMAKLAEGFHLKKIIEDTKNKAKKLGEKNGVKMYLYSAHENNVGEMMVLLDVFNNPHVPPYGSYLIFEVHNINNVIGIKLYYNNYTTDGLQLLKLPNCEEFCPIDKFESIFEEYLPSSTDLCYN